MAKTIVLTCQDCQEDFTEPVQAFIDAPGDEVMAPALCKDCGCNADD